MLAIAIVVEGQKEKGKVSQATSTIVLNAHGALMQLGEHVVIGQPLKIRNVKTGEECACTVGHVGVGQSGMTEVGIEFLEPSPRFWHVAFPPADWNPHSAEAKPHGPPASGSSQMGTAK
jgi:hypothetical protein